MKTIVFIIGGGHSGSTILDMALGSSPNAFSLGEICYLPKEVKNNTPCVCGKKIQQCPFWLGVNEIMKNRHSIDFMNAPDSLHLMDEKILKRFQKTPKILRRSRSETAGVHSQKLYDAIFEKSNAEILIDSSKTFQRARFLRPYLTDYRIAFIHLIRDVRGVVHSEKRTSYSVHFPGQEQAIVLPRTPNPPEKALRAWILGNLQISAYTIIQRLLNKSQLVLYEEFTDTPYKILSHLAEWLGLSDMDRMIHFGASEHHNVHGNPARFNSTEIKPANKRWQKELTTEELKLIKKKAGLVNWLYGFRD